MNTREIFESLNDFKQQTAWLKKNSPYYPNILTLHANGEVIMSTIIRKEHEGKWYRWHLVKRSVDGVGHLADLLNRVLMEAYNIIVLGKVNPKLTDMDGHPIFEIDADERSEAERLIETLNPKK